MTSVAIVAHAKKQLDGGLMQLRDVLASRGITDPLWYEVAKSRLAPACVKKAISKGADLVIQWGGDGTVQRGIDAAVGHPVTLGILPAGTANLLATNLGIPKDLEQALDIALHGHDRTLDVGKMNGEHFAVMGGLGMDALMIKDADGHVKDRFGRAAYVWAGARRLRTKPIDMKIKVDGVTWFDGPASCVLVGNVGKLMGGITAFDAAQPDDGVLDVAVITADGAWQWARALTRAVAGKAEKSPLVQVSQGRKISVRAAKKLPYEMDGGARTKTDRLSVKVVPGAVTVRVPDPGLSA